MNRDDRVLAIVLAAEHLLDLARFDLRGERRERLIELRADGLSPSAHSMSTARSSARRFSEIARSRSSSSRRRRCSTFCAEA